ncbi:MAG TPA: stage III sporulation protein AA, partial [Ruminiclostridium sp.]|nr:stage III sporulation protein AA [Ruminiclostridium sp.]
DSTKARIQEIRLRINRPVVLSLPDGPMFITQNGAPALLPRAGLLTARRENIDEAYRLICDCSVHSHQREIKNGFVTIRGGHRAGICGTAVTEDDSVVNIRDISSINLRIARDIEGAAKNIAKTVISEGRVVGTLIFGPPGCGKTTVLRDLARMLSNGSILGRIFRVAIVDERGEIAATFHGSPQNDLGICCDVLDGYPKGEGIMQAVRSLSPDVVICDEIGGEEDEKAVELSLNAGVSVIASAHAGSITELLSRPQTSRLIESGAFKFGVRLAGREHPGYVLEVYNKELLKKAV